MNSTVKERKVVEQENKSKFGNSLFIGLIASVFFTVALFLMLESFRILGIAILCGMAGLFFVEVYVVFKLRERSQTLKCSFAIMGVIFNIMVFFSIVVYFVAPTQLFYPNFNNHGYKQLKNNRNAEEVVVNTGTGKISGWFLHNVEGKAPLIIYYGGNGADSSTCILRLVRDNTLQYFKGYNFVMMDYPGYGNSHGNPGEESFKQFGLEVFDQLSKRSDVDKDNIVVLGYSIGTGVANYVASQRNVLGLMLMAPYADGYDLYNNVFNVFHGPVKALITYKMEAAKFAKTISVKPLILATKSDEMVPYDSSVRLSKVYSLGCDFKIIEGITHGEFWHTKAALEQLSKYLQEVLKQ